MTKCDGLRVGYKGQRYEVRYLDGAGAEQAVWLSG